MSVTKKTSISLLGIVAIAGILCAAATIAMNIGVDFRAPAWLLRLL